MAAGCRRAGRRGTPGLRQLGRVPGGRTARRHLPALSTDAAHRGGPGLVGAGRRPAHPATRSDGSRAGRRPHAGARHRIGLARDRRPSRACGLHQRVDRRARQLHAGRRRPDPRGVGRARARECRDRPRGRARAGPLERPPRARRLARHSRRPRGTGRARRGPARLELPLAARLGAHERWAVETDGDQQRHARGPLGSRVDRAGSGAPAWPG